MKILYIFMTLMKQGELLFFLIVGLFSILIIVIAALTRQRQIKRIEEAREEYQRSLRMLKATPISADLRQETLELGRKYSNLVRDKKGVAIFDEVALMNDINAACAGATALHSSVQPEPEKQSIEERLRNLSYLKVKGLITEQEYQSRRIKILDEV